MELIRESDISKKVEHSTGTIFILTRAGKLYMIDEGSILFSGYENIKDVYYERGTGVTFVDSKDRIGGLSALYNGRALGPSGYTGGKKVSNAEVSGCVIC
jgi:hypothetical protein